jgi:serine/threonine-protein kinase
VAIKVLRPELAAVIGGERFLAEIRTTANLQHPHILPLFDSGESDSFLYYVMPYIEGESLRQRIDREKQLGVDDAVRIAKDVADALHYAHGKGVIHRDIKPANILLHHGRPVVADFGIAVAISAAGGGRMTETGLSLGTPHYMSPEQASADRDLTARSDVYSLGCVLYEMLAGQPPHTGPSAQSVLVRILTDTPRALTEIRHTVPPHVAAVVAKAVEKLPADRFESAAGFMEALEDEGFRYAPAPRTAASAGGAGSGHVEAFPAGADPGGTGGGLRALPLWSAGVLALVAVGIGYALRGAVTAPPEPPPSATFSITSDAEHSVVSPCCGRAVAVSPAGDRIVYQGMPAGSGDVMLFQRPLNQRVAQVIPGTEGARHPFFSPDGEWVAYFSGDVLKKVRFDGGSPLTVLSSVPTNRGAAWGSDGSIIYALGSGGGLQRVSADGGDVTVITTPDTASGERAHRFPHILPDGRSVLFGILTSQADGSLQETIGIAAVEGGPHRVVGPGATPSYVEPGFLVYSDGGMSLMAQPFDPSRGEVTGSRFRVADGGTWRGPNAGLLEYDISPTGTLAYLESGYSAEGNDQLVLVNSSGQEQIVLESGGFLRHPRFSPDGRYVAYELEAAAADELDDIWLLDLERTNSIRVTFEFDNSAPVWSPDGARVLFESDGALTTDGIQARRADGAGETETLQEIAGASWPYVTPDGRWLLATARSGESWSILMGPVDGSEPMRPLIDTGFNEYGPAVSPDGRWIAYTSDDSGIYEIYVEPFPELGRRFKLTTGGATGPVWAPDGSRLYYRRTDSVDFNLVAVDVLPGDEFDIGDREDLFSTARYGVMAAMTNYDIDPDGERFVFISEGGNPDLGEGQSHVVVIGALNQAGEGRN